MDNLFAAGLDYQKPISRRAAGVDSADVRHPFDGDDELVERGERNVGSRGHSSYP